LLSDKFNTAAISSHDVSSINKDMIVQDLLIIHHHFYNYFW